MAVQYFFALFIILFLPDMLLATVNLIPKPHFIAKSNTDSLPVVEDEIKALLKVNYDEENTNIRLHFPEKVEIVAFKRHDALWVLTSKSFTFLWDHSQVQSSFLQKIHQIQTTQGTFVRFDLVNDPKISIKASGQTWEINFTTTLPSQEHKTYEPKIIQQNNGKHSLFLSQTKASRPRVLTMPGTDKKMVFIPFGNTSNMYNNLKNIDFSLIPCLHGMIIFPHSTVLEVAATSGGITIHHKHGILLSTKADRQKVDKHHFPPSYFAFKDWYPEQTDWTVLQFRLQQRLVELPKDKRTDARIDLARFYLMTRRGYEAIASLQVSQYYDPSLQDNPGFQALIGVSQFLAGQYHRALKTFSKKYFNNDPEIILWRTAAQTMVNPDNTSLENLKTMPRYLQSYPPFISNQLILAFAQLALHHKQPDYGLLAQLKDPYLRESQLQHKDFIQAQFYLLDNNKDMAIPLLEKLAQDTQSEFAVKSKFLLIGLQVNDRQIEPKEEIKQLEQIRYSWKGDLLEFNILKRLGYLYIRQNKYAEGLQAIQQAITRFPEEAKIINLEGFAGQAFFQAFQEESDTFPLSSLALYNAYQNFIPQDARKQHIRIRLVDKLIQMDLLEQAAGLLEEELKIYPTGSIKRGHIENKLARIYLVLKKPDRALATMQTSTLYPKDEKARLHLQAGAFIVTNRVQEMRELAEKLPVGDAQEYLLKLYLRTENWEEAIKILEPIVEQEKEPKRILDLAIAYLFTSNDRKMQKLRSSYYQQMDKTDLKDVFALVTTTDFTDDTTTKKAIMHHLQESQDIQEYLNQYQAQISDDKYETQT